MTREDAKERFSTRTAFLLVALLLTLLACLVTAQKPVPEPVVSLDFVREEDILPMVRLSFRNVGPTTVRLWDGMHEWRIARETPAGWITNRARSLHRVAWQDYEAGNSSTILVLVPVDIQRWRVSTLYGFQDRQAPISDLRSRLSKSAHLQNGRNPIAGFLAWCLQRLPDPPPPAIREVWSPVLTNSWQTVNARAESISANRMESEK